MNLDFLNRRVTAYVAILLFIIAKIPHLSYAFFWDESWVYAPGIKLMYAHGPSLAPDAIPLDYARGHPLLYHAASAAWMRIFGDSNFVMHSFALFVSVLLAVGVYECMRRLFGARCALLCVIVLLLNLVFFANSTFVLTDISIALFAFLALYFWCEEKYVLASVLMALLFLTKESGLVMAVVAGLDILMDVFRRTPFKRIITKSCALLFSLLPLLVFFIDQKRLFGWYLYPLHASAIYFGLDDTLMNFQRSLGYMFYRSMAFFPVLLLMITLIVLAASKRKPLYLLPVLAAIAVYLQVIIFSWKDVEFYVFGALVAISWIIFLIKPLSPFTLRQQRFIKLAASFAILFVYFCCVNFFEDRYLFPTILFTLVLLGISFDYVINRLDGRIAAAVVFSGLTIAGIVNLAQGKGDLDVYDRIKVQQHLVDYLEQHRYYNSNIYAKSFFSQIHLRDPKTGFRNTSQPFTHVTDTLTGSTEFAEFNSVDLDRQQYELTQRDTNFVLLDHYQVNEIWVDIFARKPGRQD